MQVEGRGDRHGNPDTAAPVLLRNALHWSQVSGGPRVGLLTREHSRHHKPLPMLHLCAVIARLRQTLITMKYNLMV